MYAALWRVIPGNRWVKIVVLTAGGIVVTALLMMFAFPWIDNMMASQESAVG